MCYIAASSLSEMGGVGRLQDLSIGDSVGHDVIMRISPQSLSIQHREPKLEILRMRYQNTNEHPADSQLVVGRSSMETLWTLFD